MARRGKTMRRHKRRGGALDEVSIESLKEAFKGNPDPEYYPKNQFNFLKYLLHVKTDPNTTADDIKNADLDELVRASKTFTQGTPVPIGPYIRPPIPLAGPEPSLGGRKRKMTKRRKH